ncbi:hypothetical protein GJ744_006306 [Endocarpon pusillum]|uniref:Uncharacterized protein n=1 Tax=Endocarpon pusillum TaxID=364733 RepID=A0A8H7DY21_9EURO|nr:hypothetical protein GJ744_006306 [Endocarpon pusillum]
MRQLVRFTHRHETPTNVSEDWSALREDYEFLSSSIDERGQRLENIVQVVTSLVQLVESRRALVETYNVTRLTVLALVFIPLSFAASLFSRNDSWKPGTDHFWVYWAVAVPSTLVVLLVAALAVRFVPWVGAKIKSIKPTTLPK